ncbi:T9SS C-terminal target domain-containing protein [Polaribacter sp. WD7]|uniref:T9SS type A sorting domain-containing protein n=1 Tax=Polaribacter sp. WD7 TaxID=2269061 RepID=UPI000DF4BBDC|nr:T9SS type A sorting domain-containing protein [Polaribacter sp. WD7]RCS27447.1 T9SS C-terminal target domain-containing protein [Polaribacter sp. WD7]
MKKITFLFLSLAAFSVFAQDVLTSTTDEFFDGSTWTINSKTEYTYDTKGNVVIEKYLSDNNADGNLDVLETTTYTYNSSNRVIEENFGDFRNEYTYTNNLPTLVISFELEDGNWVRESRIEISYNQNRIDSYILYGWNGQAWVLEDEKSERLKYIYTGVNLTMITSEDYEDGKWVNGGKDEYTYDTNNRLIKEEFFSSDDNGSFKLEEFYNYSYDSNNNVIRETGGYSDRGTIVNFKPDTYQYDTTVLMSNVIHPFNDKYGVEIFPEESDNFVNKILNKTSEDSRIIYNYNGATASRDEFNSFAFKVYPNPTTSKLTIDDTGFSLENMEVYNILGKKIMSSFSNSINLEDIDSGLYILKVNTIDGRIATKRIVKK